MGSKGVVNYGGNEMKWALHLVSAEVKPGLPMTGVAASVDILPLCDPVVAAWTSDPKSKLPREDEWPEDVPKAPVHCTADQWSLLCKMLWGHNMVRAIALKDVFHTRGKFVFIGAFAVEKRVSPCRVASSHQIDH